MSTLASDAGPLVPVGALNTVARAGDEALAGSGRVGSGAVADDGFVAFSTPGALFLTVGGVTRPILHSGHWPYRSFGELDLASGGALLFHARLAGGREGLFLHTPTGIRPVAASGDRSPAGVAYASFSQPSVVSVDGTAVALAFRATLTDGRVCIVHQPPNQPSMITLASGMSLPDGTIADMSISRLGLALCCVATMSDGCRKVLIVHGSTVVSGDWFDGLDRVLAPPAISAQLGFVTVGFADGRTALCTRPPGITDPEVLVASGDRVPGSADRTIDHIGPPVASNCAALRIPFGVAAPVHHDDGGYGIWLGVFTSQLPVAGIVMAPVAEGMHTDDRHDQLVGPLTPLSLSNAGTLLFRDRDALLTIDGLFNLDADERSDLGGGQTRGTGDEHLS